MKQRLISAFSFVEVLLIVATIGILATVGTTITTQMIEGARRQKLESDAATLNRSVSAYLASGGDLSRARSAEEVISALKRGFSNAARLPGWGGAKLDERVQFTFQNDREVGSGKLSIQWSPNERSFRVARTEKVLGIKEVYLDDTPRDADKGENSDGEGSTAHTGFEYASHGTWIWDYQDGASPPSNGVDPMNTSTAPDNALPPASPPSGGGGPAALTILSPPNFSIPSGSYPIESFELPLTLTNPNPSGSSEVYYSVNSGNWQLYTSSILVAPDAVISARAITIHPRFSNSDRSEETYKVAVADLLTPIISPSRPEFGVYIGHDITVAITDQNAGGTSKLEYRIGNGPWQAYTDPFLLCRSDYLTGAVIQARAVPTSAYYNASPPASESLGVEKPMIAGSSDGSFSNPKGDKNMITNLPTGQSSNRFAWGRDYFLSSETPSKDGIALNSNFMEFQGTSFSGVTPGERFEIGNLIYFNGTTVIDTNATSINFTADISLNLNGVTRDVLTDFKFDLVNVKNNYKDPWADADYVRLATPSSNKIIDFNGIQFRFELEFGSSSSSGYTTFDQFYVLEDETASAKMYGRLVEIGNIGFNHSPLP